MGKTEGKRRGLRVELREITEAFPRSLIETILAETDRTGVRRRKLPGYLMVYYVIALGLMVSVSTREVLRRLLAGVRDQGPEGEEMIASRRRSARPGSDWESNPYENFTTGLGS